MSTSKHIDKLCIAAVSLTLVLTTLFMCVYTPELASAAKTMKYESTVFDNSYVHTIDIVMTDWDSFIENCESEEYSPCTVVIDGTQHKNIAIRAKGNTSLSAVRSLGSQRYSFKLEFDHYEDGKTLDGLDKLCLNNLIQDNTMMKDYVVYQLMNGFGVDAPLCSFAYLTVNGEDWGLYLAVEGVEDSFLERNYGSDSGELYKPDSMSFGGGRGNGKDFKMDGFDFEISDNSVEVGDTPENSPDRQSDAPPQKPEGEERQNDRGGEPPEGFGGGIPRGNAPDMPGGGFDGEPPQMPDGAPDMPDGMAGDIPQRPEGNLEMSDGADAPEMPGGNAPGDPNGGMGSDDVKLKYIDDNADSYPNIFDNAKTDVSVADEKRLISALKSLSEYSELESVLDTDEVLRYFVVHDFVCNGDSYTGAMIHNYYLHEKNGRLGMIPWDYNLAFGTFEGSSASSAVNASIDSPVSGGSTDDRPMVGWIFSDEQYTGQYHALFKEFLDEWFSGGRLSQLISDTAEMIRPYVEKDPTKFCTVDEFDAGVSALSGFVSLRAEAVTRQLAGDGTAVDVGALDLADMGTMSDAMGQRSTRSNRFSDTRSDMNVTAP